MFSGDNLPISRSEASRVAISGLDIKGIRELKSLANPPKAVGDVFSVVLAITGNKEREWSEARKKLANPKNFISSMADYDFGSLSEKQLKDVKKQITKVGGTFDHDTLASKSAASA